MTHTLSLSLSLRPSHFRMLLYDIAILFNHTGGTTPVVVTQIQSIVTSFSTVNISWTVTQITYTPETYTVVYGIDRLNLNERSVNISGVTHVGEYTIEIQQLQHSTVYYYLVESSNTVGRVSSAIHSFEVQNACKRTVTSTKIGHTLAIRIHVALYTVFISVRN